MQSVNGNLVASQPAQALGVCSPITGRSGGDTPIVVKVYALGRGVSLVGQRGNLSLREGAFELEAHGKVFVIDPLAAGHANGFVAPVEGCITPVGEPVQTINQKDLAEFRNSGQFDAPSKTTILSLPQGTGKSLIANQLASALGCHCVVDEWTPHKRLTVGALHLTSEDELDDSSMETVPPFTGKE